MTASPTTDEALASLLEVGGAVAVPYFDGATLRVEPGDVPIAEALPAVFSCYLPELCTSPDPA